MRMEEEASSFLEKLGMTKYISGFESLGFDALDTLVEANDDILKQIGVPIGFRIKFNKAKSDLKFKQAVGASGSNLLATQKTESFNLIINDEQSEGRQARNPPENSEKPQSQQSGSKQASGVANPLAQVDTAIEACNFECAPINTTKYCFRCFKKIAEVFASNYAPNKAFCSSVCLKFFFLEQSTLCSNPSCGAVSVKSSAVLASGSWFCSESCAATRPKLLEAVETAVEDDLPGENLLENAQRPEAGAQDRQVDVLAAKTGPQRVEDIDLSFEL